MSDNQVANEVCEPEKKTMLKKNKKILKLLPSAVTVTAFCFGLTAIKFAFFQGWNNAVMCVFAAALLDAFDGKVARMLGQSSQFGAELDSLSDLVCFGVAPAVILFLSVMYQFGSIGWGVCMFYTACCALRLARFNAAKIEDAPEPGWMKKFFNGVPAPAGAILALSPLIFFYAAGEKSFMSCYLVNKWFVACVLLASGSLMISTIKTFSSKMVELGNTTAITAMMVMVLFAICLITQLWLTLSLLVLAYIVSIPIGACEYSKRLQEHEAVEKEDDSQ